MRGGKCILALAIGGALALPGWPAPARPNYRNDSAPEVDVDAFYESLVQGRSLVEGEEPDLSTKAVAEERSAGRPAEGQPQARQAVPSAQQQRAQEQDAEAQRATDQNHRRLDREQQADERQRQAAEQAARRAERQKENAPKQPPQKQASQGTEHQAQAGQPAKDAPQEAKGKKKPGPAPSPSPNLTEAQQ